MEGMQNGHELAVVVPLSAPNHPCPSIHFADWSSCTLLSLVAPQSLVCLLVSWTALLDEVVGYCSHSLFYCGFKASQRPPSTSCCFFNIYYFMVCFVSVHFSVTVPYSFCSALCPVSGVFRRLLLFRSSLLVHCGCFPTLFDSRQPSPVRVCSFPVFAPCLMFSFISVALDTWWSLYFVVYPCVLFFNKTIPWIVNFSLLAPCPAIICYCCI